MQLKLVPFALVSVCALLTSAAPAAHKPKPTGSAVNINAFASAVSGFCEKHVLDLGAQLTDKICLDVDADIDIKATGLINAEEKVKDLDLLLKASIRASIDTILESDFSVHSQFYASLQAKIKAIFLDQCGTAHDFKTCVKSNSEIIAVKVHKASTSLALKIAADVKLKLKAAINASVDVCIKDFTVNLLVEKVTVTGKVKVTAKASAYVDAWVQLFLKDSAYNKVLAKLIVSLC